MRGTTQKKRQWGTRWMGPLCSNVRYPVQLSAEIHTMNINNNISLILLGMIAGRRTQLLIILEHHSHQLIVNSFYNCHGVIVIEHTPPPNLCFQLADRS